MVYYSVLIIVINRRFLPGAFKLKGWRPSAMVLAFLSYGYFAG